MKELTKKFNNVISEVRDLEKNISDLNMNDGSYIVRFDCISQLLDDIRIDLEVKEKYQNKQSGIFERRSI